MKVVVNRCFGGFGLSAKAIKLYCEKIGKPIFRIINKERLDYLSSIYQYLDWDANEIFCYYITKPLNEDGTMQEDSYFAEWEIERSDPILVQVVEELEKESWGVCAELEVVEIPDGIDWYIHEYDGNETIHENHRSW